MNTLKRFARRFYADEKAAEVTELGIVLALVVAASVAVLAAIGPKILQAYNLTNNSLP